MNEMPRPSNEFSSTTYVPKKPIEFSHELYALLSDAVGAEIKIDVAMDANSVVEQIVARYTDQDEEEILSAIAGAIKRYRFNFIEAALDRIDVLAMQHLDLFADLKSTKRPVYALKLEEARRLATDPQASAPLLRSEAEKTGQTVESLANTVIRHAESFNASIATIESDRILAKKKVREAKTQEEAMSVLEWFENTHPLLGSS